MACAVICPGSAAGYIAAQCLGAVAGVIATHGMFGLPLLETATKPRPGFSLMWSEFVATVGLLLVVTQSLPRRGPK